MVVFESTFLPMDWKCWWIPLWFPGSTIAIVSYMTSQNTREISYKEFRIPQLEWYNRSPQLDHITPLIKSLHWLPVEARIHFKIFLITYKILNGQSAGYLEPLNKVYYQSRALRSSSRSLLCTPAITSKTYGGRAFSTAPPQLWNTTPEYIKNADSVAAFKTKLKAFLFRKCFNCFSCLTF